MSRIGSAWLPAMALAVAGAIVTHAQSTPRTRSVYVSALDGKGVPVAGMTAAEFLIKEDGQSRTVVSAAPAATKLTVVVLVDDGGVGMNDIRIGVAGLMNRLLVNAEFSLVGIAEQNRTFVELTSENSALARAIQALRPRNVSGGGHLVEAVLDAMTVEEKKEVARPVIVVVTNQGREYGTLSPEPVLQQLARSGTALYVVEALRRSGQSGASPAGYDAMAQGAADNEAADADRARNKILADGPKQTGGRREEVLNTADIPAVLQAIAEDLAGQYLLVYASDAPPGAPARIAISTSRKNVKVRAPARAPDRKPA